MRVWFSGRICPSQGHDTGSIPVTRSRIRVSDLSQHISFALEHVKCI